MKRIKASREERLKGAADRRKLADKPSLFRETKNPKRYILFPLTTSENRRYIPLGFLDENTIPTNSATIIEDADLYDFGIYQDNIFIILINKIHYLKGFYFNIKDMKVNKFEKNPIFSEFAAKEESKAQNLEQYNQYLIYEDEEIIKYDFLKDKRMTLGKGNYSKRYKRIDKYFFNTEKRIIELD